MKNSFKKTIYLILSIAMSLLFLAACSLNKDPAIVTIDGHKLSIKDFYYDIYPIESDGNKQEEEYQKKLGCSFWDYIYNGTTVREAAKSSILASAVMYYILSDQAGQNGMKLTKEELKANEAAVNDILKEARDGSLKADGMNYEALKAAADRKTLGEKYRKEITKNFRIDEEAVKKSLDRAVYREYKTECLSIPIFIANNKELAALKEAEKASAYSDISKALAMLQKGADFDTVRKLDNKLIYNTRDFISGDITYEEAYKASAMALDNNELSTVIETNYAYYIIHMLDNNSQDRYEQAVKDAILQKEDTLFAEAYNRMKDKYDIEINFDYWDTVIIGQIFRE